MEAKVEKNKLILTIPLENEEKAPISRTGRSRIVYTTRGFIPLNEKLAVNINVIYRNGGIR